MALQSKSREKLLATKNKVSEEATTGLAVVVSACASTIQATLPAYDENGTLLGHIPLIDSATAV
jgi:hypothetical protein